MGALIGGTTIKSVCASILCNDTFSSLEIHCMSWRSSVYMYQLVTIGWQPDQNNFLSPYSEGCCEASVTSYCREHLSCVRGILSITSQWLPLMSPITLYKLYVLLLAHSGGKIVFINANGQFCCGEHYAPKICTKPR
jgi:hypothetical protein